MSGARRAQLVRAVHARPGVSRAEAARTLGISTGAAAQLVADLVAAGVLAEGTAIPSGGRGRPTRALVASPGGPLVLAAVATHERWAVEAVELGGAVLARRHGVHGGSAATLVDALRAVVPQLDRRLHGRVRGIGIAAPGLVHDGRLLDATSLGWQGVDLQQVWDGGWVVAGNDASWAALGEARRGAARGAALALHLYLDAGVGGAVTTGGEVVPGAHGLAGEFGHMPFGDPAARCPCGASGCWNLALEPAAVARALGEEPTSDPVSFVGAVLGRAVAGERAAHRAAAVVARSLGRGIAGLVNGLDVDRVVLGGLAPRLLEIAGDDLLEALSAGLMHRRRVHPPDVVPAAFGDRGPLVGAAELMWSRLVETL